MMARAALVAGGLLALLLTPGFALSYFTAYDEPDEAPRGWLVNLHQPLLDAGLLNDGSQGTYDIYGLLYLVAWIIALVGLAFILRGPAGEMSTNLRRAWKVVGVSLALVALGILGDYGVPNDIIGGIGFIVTGLGFLSAALGCVVLGWTLRREQMASTWVALVVACLGVTSVIGGFALVGHIPSGPGLGYAIGAVLIGIMGRDAIPTGVAA